MPASYPGAIKSFTTKTNKVDLVDAAHMNDVQNEVTAIETELGINVRGSATDLVARLARALANNGAIANGTAFPTSPTPIDGQIFYRTDENICYVYNGTTWDAQSGITNYAAGSYLIFGPSEIYREAGGTVVKKFEMFIPRGGTLRIVFGASSNTSGPTVYTQIYRNGTAVGTLRSLTNQSWTEYSQDIPGWAIGDLLQIYAWCDGPITGQYVFSGGLRLYENAPTKEAMIDTYRTPTIWKGSGTPSGNGLGTLGNIGDFYIDLNGGASTTLYVKTGSTTWTAK